MSKGDKRKGKVRLPRDREGRPIRIDDVLMWGDGTTLKVTTMTYYGDGYEHIGCWDATGTDEDYSDNLEASLNLTAMAEERGA